MGRGFALLTGAIPILGCSGKPPPPPPPAVVNPPATPILFQPVLEFADGKKTRQGTGFAVRTPDGRAAAVSCSHILKFDGPPIRRAIWTEIPDGTQVQNFVKSWGKPGEGGLTDSRMLSIDLRSDYFVMPWENNIDESRLLVLDERSRIEEGERVWFPNKNPKAALGFDMVNGNIHESHIKYHVLMLEEPIELATQSGTPVISQVTGKVVGILSRDGTQYGRNMLGQELKGSIFLLTPSAVILKVFESYSDYVDLSAVTGSGK